MFKYWCSAGAKKIIEQLDGMVWKGVELSTEFADWELNVFRMHKMAELLGPRASLDRAAMVGR